MRQTLMATNLAPGALVAWKVPADRVDEAFDFMVEAVQLLCRPDGDKIESAQLLVWTVDLATNEPVYTNGVRELIALPEHLPLSAEAYRACIHEEDRERERASFEAA